MKFIILQEQLFEEKKNWAKWSGRKRFDLDASSAFHHHSHPSPKPSFFISWAKPPGGFIKINFDGSQSSSSAARGFVIGDWIGRFLQAETMNIGEALVLVVEATQYAMVYVQQFKQDIIHLFVKVIIRYSSKP